ncbi:hypothetical protein ASF92_09070 [Pedobacter sp. Leaf176]|nr:hypothetical protein ASF92_09070 [Pedobacter sp. Leaf176]
MTSKASLLAFNLPFFNYPSFELYSNAAVIYIFSNDLKLQLIDFEVYVNFSYLLFLIFGFHSIADALKLSLL